MKTVKEQGMNDIESEVQRKERLAAAQAFRRGEHYRAIDGLPEWAARQAIQVEDERRRFKALCATGDELRCLGCGELLGPRNQHVQVLSDGRVRCASCRKVAIAAA